MTIRKLLDDAEKTGLKDNKRWEVIRTPEGVELWEEDSENNWTLLKRGSISEIQEDVETRDRNLSKKGAL